jgi:hypothetical protein
VEKTLKFSEIQLPSNKKFGFFFAFVFAIAAAYFFNFSNMIWAYISAGTSFIFLVITLVRDELLLPLNKLWMRIGLLLGIIVSPIVLGVIFFGLFTPIAFLMRLSGRDELSLKFSKKPSHWILRSEPIKPESFKQQF